MWHSTILKNIDWSHYFNDVFKLEDEQLQITVNSLERVISDLYLVYLKEDASKVGALARALIACGIPPFSYIPPPLTTTIDEIDWAITHGYVHPRDVVVFNVKGAPMLLSKVSMDFLKSFNKSVASDRIKEYIENEISVRGKGEDAFVVTPCDKFPYVKLLTTNTNSETKAARTYFINLANRLKPVKEESTEVVNGGLTGEGLRSFIERVDRPLRTTTSIIDQGSVVQPYRTSSDELEERREPDLSSVSTTPNRDGIITIEHSPERTSCSISFNDFQHTPLAVPVHSFIQNLIHKFHLPQCRDHDVINLASEFNHRGTQNLVLLRLDEIEIGRPRWISTIMSSAFTQFIREYLSDIGVDMLEVAELKAFANYPIRFRRVERSIFSVPPDDYNAQVVIGRDLSLDESVPNIHQYYNRNRETGRTLDPTTEITQNEVSNS